MKANTHTKGVLRAYNGGSTTTPLVIFDLSAGTVIASYGDATSPTITSVGNGWYRCTMTFITIGSPAGIFPHITNLSNTYTYQSSFNYLENFSNTGSIYIWGAQLEQSSYATSLINTTSASATRVADACSKTGISSLIGQTEGVFFADYNYTQHGANIEVVMSLQGATTSSYFEMYYNNNTLNANIYNAGSPQAGYTSSTQASGRYKIAFAYKANDFAMYINGTQVMTDSSGTVPTLSNWAIGYDFASGLYQFGNSVNQAILFPTRLTNAELASLTTI
jgi:hypothetical protein